jgi:hypothetical protein
MEAFVPIGLNADIFGKAGCRHTREFGGWRKGGLQADLKHEAFAIIHTTFFCAVASLRGGTCQTLPRPGARYLRLSKEHSILGQSLETMCSIFGRELSGVLLLFLKIMKDELSSLEAECVLLKREIFQFDIVIQYLFSIHHWLI